MIMDVTEIQKIIPHRYPFLLLDRVTEIKENESLIGFKNITIGDNVVVGAQSGVSGGLAANGYYSGTPAMEHRDWLKAMGVMPKLPDLRKRIADLEKRISALELEE